MPHHSLLPPKYRRLEVFLEFLLYGLAVGIVEDLIAVKIVSDEPITWKIVGIVAAVAVPFAFLGEVIIDRTVFLPRSITRRFMGSKGNGRPGKKS